VKNSYCHTQSCTEQNSGHTNGSKVNKINILGDTTWLRTKASKLQSWRFCNSASQKFRFTKYLLPNQRNHPKKGGKFAKALIFLVVSADCKSVYADSIHARPFATTPNQPLPSKNAPKTPGPQLVHRRNQWRQGIGDHRGQGLRTAPQGEHLQQWQTDLAIGLHVQQRNPAGHVLELAIRVSLVQQRADLARQGAALQTGVVVDQPLDGLQVLGTEAASAIHRHDVSTPGLQAPCTVKKKARKSP